MEETQRDALIHMTRRIYEHTFCSMHHGVYSMWVARRVASDVVVTCLTCLVVGESNRWLEAQACEAIRVRR